MGRREAWEDIKSRLPESLLRERDIGYLDPGIEEILEKLNSLPQLATTSTCIGRVMIVASRYPWERGDESSIVVYKTHDKVRIEDVLRTLSNNSFCYLWFKVSPPIFHVRVKSLECAQYLIEKARKFGFKHSGIISHNEVSGIVVELMSSAQLVSPLILDCVPLYRNSLSSIERLVDMSNEIVGINRERLNLFSQEISSEPGPCGSD
ncbi:MAG: hypothetical protein F7C35_02905 [Desulfurococcales archaeon]|nr:hypothetical protein [Desulfurococcales archaeon]